MSARWFCGAHRLTTASDCPKCDAELIADLDEYARTPACHACQRTLRVGDSAWASDWTVIEAGSARTETRYICDDCEAKR